MTQPKVSIIIPVYNIEAYLRQCLESAANQTLSDIEVIMVDDGSTDSSAAICKEFAEKHPNFSYYYKENGGPASARNMGLEHAQGEYVGFIDSDDWVEPDMYEKLYMTAKENRDCDIVFCRVFEEECPGAYDYIMPRSGYFDREAMERELFPYLLPCLTEKGNFRSIRWCNWLRIIKRKVIEKFHIRTYEGTKRGEDLCFLFECTIHSESYYYLDECLYHNRPHCDSISRGYMKNMPSAISGLNRYLTDVAERFTDYDFKAAVGISSYFFCTTAMWNEMLSDSKKERIKNIEEILADDLCRKSLRYIDFTSLSKKQKGLYNAVKTGRATEVISYCKWYSRKRKIADRIMRGKISSALWKILRHN